MKIRHIAIPFLLAAASPFAFAATNPAAPGTTSVGDTQVQVVIDESILVSAIQDVTLTYTAGSNAQNSTPLCIYRRNNAAIDLTLSSANAAGTTFNMAGTAATAGALIPYAVSISGADTVGSVNSGATATLAGADPSSTNCGGTPSHTITVDVLAVDLDAAQADTYTDTITILAEPT